MILDYDYYITSEEAYKLKKDLNINFEIAYVTIRIEFGITLYRPSTRWHEAEGGELEVKSQKIMYCTSVQDDNPIMLTDAQKVAISDIIDYNELDSACYEAWECNQEDTSDYYY